MISWIGSFTNIRGGHNYPWLVRNSARKPIKVFLQDGSNDLNNQHGSWPLANQEMYAALTYAGYDAKLAWGEGNHSGTHGASVLPDTLRWLWAKRSEPVYTLAQLEADEADSGVDLPRFIRDDALRLGETVLSVIREWDRNLACDVYIVGADDESLELAFRAQPATTGASNAAIILRKIAACKESGDCSSQLARFRTANCYT